jgi:hypothetical protein
VNPHVSRAYDTPGANRVELQAKGLCRGGRGLGLPVKRRNREFYIYEGRLVVIDTMFCDMLVLVAATVLKVVAVFVLSLLNVVCYITFPDAIEGHEVTVSELLFDPFCD